MPAYILRIAGTNILAGFYAAPTGGSLLFSSMRRRTPATSSAPSFPKATASSSARPAAPVKLIIGDPEASEALEAADYIYLTEDLSDSLGANMS